MKFWQQKWRSMNGFRRMILVVLALMLVGSELAKLPLREMLGVFKLC